MKMDKELEGYRDDIGILWKIFIAVMLIALCFLLFGGIFTFNESIHADSAYREACNRIGYSNYKILNTDIYCTSDNVNLFRVDMESTNFWNTKFNATKLNLYNYGENK